MLCKSVTKYAGIVLFENSFIFKVLHGIDVGGLTRNIAKEKKPDVLQAILWNMLQVSAFFQQVCEILWIS